MWEWLLTTVYNSPYQTTQIQHLKFAFVRSRSGSKKNVTEKISTLPPSNYFGLANQIHLIFAAFCHITHGEGNGELSWEGIEGTKL
jgi:hypothetical protein